MFGQNTAYSLQADLNRQESIESGGRKIGFPVILTILRPRENHCQIIYVESETMKNAHLLCLAALLLLGVTASTANAQEPILDQVNDVPTDSGSILSSAAVNAGSDQAQVFTVGISGVLHSVRLKVRATVDTAEDLIFDIRSADGGIPIEDDMDVLGSVSVAASEIPTSDFFADEFTTFELFDLGINVEVGDQLAIVLRSEQNDAGNLNDYDWLTSFPGENTYADGSSFQRTDAGWVESTGARVSDLDFRTFVAVPEPCHAILLCLGLPAMLARRRNS